MNWVYLAIGFVMGGIGMFYWIQWADLFRTRGEHQLAKLLGNKQMNYFCEEAAKGGR